jgi:hypothetical protein
MPKVISVFSPVLSALPAIVQPSFGTSFPHLGHFVKRTHPLFDIGSMDKTKYKIYESSFHFFESLSY